tara:strand:- start:1265 stop:1693 length:429 start_codon:yes stop_codon:yes gene_type:complete
MTEKEIEEELARKQKMIRLSQLNAEDCRAQTLSIGNAGGGTSEITMRSTSGTFLWNTYQPAEVIEFIHQLAANIGCHIHIAPREDFASWRNWDSTATWAPFPSINQENKHKLGARNEELPEKLQEDENEMATKKAINKRSFK